MRVESSIPISFPFEIISANDRSAIEPILNRMFKNSLASPFGGTPILGDEAGWGTEFFELHKSSIFMNLTESTQKSVLKSCSDANIEEAMFIEVAGMTFSSKMSLLAQNLNERELYCRFGADEAHHFRQLQMVLGELNLKKAYQSSFLKFLGNLIQTESRVPLILLIQVLLEGWGIHYYSTLSENTSYSEVKKIFNSIVADEASHHGSGIILFREALTNPNEEIRMAEAVGELLSMVRLGPAGILTHLYKANGGMTLNEISHFLDEVNFQEKINRDLEILKHLLTKAKAIRIIEKLERQGLFSIPSVRGCASLLSNLLGVS